MHALLYSLSIVMRDIAVSITPRPGLFPEVQPRITMYISVVLSNDSFIALNFLSSASTFRRKHCACATAYLMSVSDALLT